MPVLADLQEPAIRVVRTRSKRLLKTLQRLGDDVELWMSYLAQPHPWLSDADGLYNQSIFARVSEEIASVVRDRQDKATSTPPPDWLTTLTSIWHADRSPVLSVNYDTLIEKALYASSGVENLHAYQIPTPPVDTRKGLTAYGVDAKPTMRLFKLHGSINWYYYGPRSQSGRIYDLTFLNWQPDALAAVQEHIGGMVPVVVPPVMAKDPYFVNDTLREQWQVAASACAGTKRLFLVGYSLPPTDQLMRFFLAGTVAPNLVVPVDTGTAILSAVADMFPHAEVDDQFVGIVDAIPRFVSWYASVRSPARSGTPSSRQ